MTDRTPVTVSEARAIAEAQYKEMVSPDGIKAVTRAEWLRNRSGELLRIGAEQHEISLIQRGDQ
jgi:hypothetical protein